MSNIKKLEYRMYGLVAYQLSPIQKGIQFMHAATRYGVRFGGKETEYDDWAFLHETVVLLCGGTTNKKFEKLGTLNKYANQLDQMNVLTAPFYEEDLGDQMTAIAFLLDERVYDRKKYPDFEFVIKNQPDRLNPIFVNDVENEKWLTWVDSNGGIQVNTLREFIRPLKLAR